MKLIVTLIRGFLGVNRFGSRAINHLLPIRFTVDGNNFSDRDHTEEIQQGQNIWDIGGGSQPVISQQKKVDLALTITGLDISEDEQLAAPKGVYEKIVVAGLGSYVDEASADIVICQATLEHVPDTSGAIRAMPTILKPGGKALIFAPCRNTVFARLNLGLPKIWKKKLLYFVSPEVEEHQGLPAHYDRCTPREI